MPNVHDLRHLIHVDPSAAKKQIIDAFKKSKWLKGKVAAELNCGHGTMLKWIALLGMDDELEKLIARAKEKGEFGDPDTKIGSPTGERGPREWEIVDRKEERVSTFSSRDKADRYIEDNGGERKGWTVRKRRDLKAPPRRTGPAGKRAGATA